MADLSPVERGALLLDEHAPGWWQRIDLDTLDLDDPDLCVCGQGHPDGFGFAKGLSLDGEDPLVAYAFCSDWCFHDEWVALIQARRDAEQTIEAHRLHSVNERCQDRPEPDEFEFGDFESDEPYERYAAHAAAKGRP